MIKGLADHDFALSRQIYLVDSPPEHASGQWIESVQLIGFYIKMTAWTSVVVGAVDDWRVLGQTSHRLPVVAAHENADNFGPAGPPDVPYGRLVCPQHQDDGLVARVDQGINSCGFVPGLIDLEIGRPTAVFASSENSKVGREWRRERARRRCHVASRKLEPFEVLGRCSCHGTRQRDRHSEPCQRDHIWFQHRKLLILHLQMDYARFFRLVQGQVLAGLDRPAQYSRLLGGKIHELSQRADPAPECVKTHPDVNEIFSEALIAHLT
ncbi:hypothetical protein SAMN05216517_1113 [Janthinobacterium sp. OK676]|nr:hypothetical protein SAMN05216517_1113 [Janthinobacterium sp. OK676]